MPALSPFRLFLLILACLVRAAHATPAPATAIVTILDGSATVIRDTTRFALQEGARLAAGDIISTGAGAALLRLELDEGGFANLGPGTRALLAPRLGAAHAGARPVIYLLQGWIKTNRSIAGPALDVTPSGTAVLAMGDSHARCFAEAGGISLRPAAATPVQLHGGEYLDLTAKAPRHVEARPAEPFLAEMPHAFAETLPFRASLFAARSVTLKAAGELDYAELEPWLDAEPELRKAYLSRWTPLARRPEFREPLTVHLSRHAEWKRILFPDDTQALPADAKRSVQ